MIIRNKNILKYKFSDSKPMNQSLGKRHLPPPPVSKRSAIVSLLGQIYAEAMHRWVHSLLLFGALFFAAALPVAFHTTGSAAKRETSRLMRDLGYNVRILPKDAELTSYWAQGFADGAIPEEAVQRFTTADDLSYNHLLAVLAKRVEFRGASVLLTGIAAEVAPETKKKGSMSTKSVKRLNRKLVPH